ncbi:hypothetical protein KTT66_02190 [Lacticaseibacillus casei]|jgi:hypothetical protein|uniref:Lipoprotein n=2 Tax=Lacticaseibacillus TaxID=2759736 RepID=A0ABY9L6E9_9LACO|nr:MULTISPECIES: hypothetical protein [Lacticaseibacillus]MDE3282331.1 hypothetical protein [Lacticaseibacillus casei]MDG3061677.1 hypothetical protein [Lacticaseibacillus sp. BCRC 81376]QVI37868.1 hypothetical protein KGS74_02495 [Lacticaseibacillus casei]QXG59659.1 hypothetical protein KTT66_02190 [Lacticaseibacillus casei]WFB38878.1 hypothetical protein LHUE1_002424 [Lacticaseibacillus huelsenbergensis]
MKFWKYGLIGLLALLLVGCGQQLSTTKTTYGRDGLVATVKGNASGVKRVSYTSDAGKGSVPVNSGTFVIDVPITDKAQKVNLKAGSLKTNVTVKAGKSLGNYADIATKFNQMLAVSSLSKADQAKLKQGQAAAAALQKNAAGMTPAEKMAAAQQAQALKTLMAQATANTKANQLPTTAKTGIQSILKTADINYRASVAHGKAMGFAVIVPLAVLKDSKKMQAFATDFGLLSTAVGANAKTVFSHFKKLTKDAKSKNNATTISTIKSNGVHFDVGYSTTALYLYVTK